MLYKQTLEDKWYKIKNMIDNEGVAIWDEDIEKLLEGEEGIEFYEDKFQLVDVEKIKLSYFTTFAVR